jgi:DNA-binding MarR family transcriptional regulator
MDASTAATSFSRLFGSLYLRLYQRMDPRVWRPSQEAVLVLQHLAGTGPLTVTEAARHFDRSQAAMSELVARLIRRGLLATMTDERDRRRHLVWLTDEGHDMVRRMSQVLSPEVLEAAFHYMAPQDRAQLILSLQRLLEATGEVSQHHDEREGENHDDV